MQHNDERKIYWYLDKSFCADAPPTDYGFYSRFFASGFAWYIFYHYLLFLGLAAVWVAIFRLVWDPTEFVDKYYSHVGVGLLSVVVGYIYYNWAGECTTRFERRATYYIEIVEKISNIAATIASVLPSSETLQRRVHAENASLHIRQHDVPREVETRAIVRDISTLLCALVVAVNSTFVCDARRLSHPARRCIVDLPLTPQLFAEMQHMAPDIEPAFQHEYRPRASSCCCGSLEHQRYAQVILMVILRRLNQLKHACALDASDLTSINFALETYRQHFDSAMAFSDVYMYRLYQSFFFAVLSLYFFIMPLLFWGSFDLWVLLVYPPTILLIGGVFIITRWLGDPFEGDSVYNRLDHERRKDETCRNMYHLFARYTRAPERVLSTPDTVLKLNFG